MSLAEDFSFRQALFDFGNYPDSEIIALEIVADRNHFECEGIVAVGKAVLRQGYRAPGVFAGKPHLLFVYQQVDIVGGFHFRRMQLHLAVAFVKALDGVIEGGGGERHLAHEFQTGARGVELAPIADIGLGARLLRTDVGIESG